MRTIGWISAFVFASAGGLALAAQESAKVNIPDASWAGKALTGGRYTVSWQGEPGNVQVTLSKGRQVVATGKGRLETSKIKFRDDAVVLRRDGSGASVLTEIDIHGSTTALILEHS